MREAQPSLGTIVWQENRLAEARFNLSLREMKIIAYIVAMIDSADEDFKLYKVHIATFARLAGLDPHSLYQELKESAYGIMSKPVIIQGIEEEEGRPAAFITNWFSEVMIVSGWSGSFGVRLNPRLRPYLLQVKKSFFQFRLGYLMNLKSAYSISLYQFAKRWQFARQKRITIEELRDIMGVREFDRSGRVVHENLPLYGDFKRRALAPAIIEVNKRTDVRLSFIENKSHANRGVESITFRFAENAAPVDPSPPPQIEMSIVEQSEGDRETFALIADITTRFGLSRSQAQTLTMLAQSHGVHYVTSKVELIESRPCRNMGASLMTALNDDWQHPKKFVPKKKAPAATPAAPIAPPQSPEEIARVKSLLANFKATMRGGPRDIPSAAADPAPSPKRKMRKGQG